MAEEKKTRISLASMIFMPALAFVFDIFSLIPLINLIVAPITWIIFTIWFFLEGVNPFSGRRAAVAIGSFVIGLIPVLSMLPETTIGVVSIIFMVKSEDALGIKVPLTK
ncbi:hypothetical protein IT398_01195 [Candidatus Nomurabacteria bacterium]|nr:hypothetical protein [Candidatus Nomurabacteria bacterium]